ncbi:flavodoxin domain-containing protein [Homoserinimonas sp. OAct 916]|uniref:flavodoxin family protein n=1 Tax=Homoserinimonas sp. OAct 916 TaxID=2211450 RepID=UPI000DBE365A|nr:flavodoxin domain-containing protein [Homoserinimonas sp. OAct 916]
MNTLIVYETMWGNTELIARAIGAELSSTVTVDIVDSDSAPPSIEGFDLLVVGAPTHAFSLSRPATRQEAASERNAPHVPVSGVREWLQTLSRTENAVTAVAFDTRVDTPRLPGSAAKVIRRELRSLGFETSQKAKTFRVHGYEGPLVDGEPARAAAWIRSIASARESNR